MPPKRRLLFGIPPSQWIAVFVIIALMYAILYPVFQKVKKNTRDYRCLPHMRELGLALAQYEQDNDSVYPSGYNMAGNGWAGKIFPYVLNKEVYRCPDDDEADPFISYAENRSLVGQFYGNLTAPDGTVALYELTTRNCSPSLPEAVSTTGLSAPQNSRRHDDPPLYPFELNFLYADGHGKMLTPGQVSSGKEAVPPTHKAGYLATFAVK